MEDFVKENIKSTEILGLGVIVQTLNDGRKRKIDVFRLKVEIYNKEGGIVSSSRLETSHHLMGNASGYYYFNYLLKKIGTISSYEIKRMRYYRKKLKHFSTCEEYYKIY